jgi:hypothetical protein
MIMINGCGNCANYVWGDNKTPLPSECITCTTTHVPNGQHPTPSHWKAKPQTNADRIRAMSDEELKYIVRSVIKSQDCPMGETECTDCVFHDLCLREDYYNNEEEWLKQPAKVRDNA